MTRVRVAVTLFGVTCLHTHGPLQWCFLVSSAVVLTHRYSSMVVLFVKMLPSRKNMIFEVKTVWAQVFFPNCACQPPKGLWFSVAFFMETHTVKVNLSH